MFVKTFYATWQCSEKQREEQMGTMCCSEYLRVGIQKGASFFSPSWFAKTTCGAIKLVANLFLELRFI
jgi:hypothetical protein